MPKASILLASSEVVGYAKTGGLADVCGSLPPAVERLGHRAAVILPLYYSAKNSPLRPEPTDITVDVPFDGRTESVRLWKGGLPDSEVTVWLVEHPEYYERDVPPNKGGYYQRTLPNGDKVDYDDNWARFGFFSRAVLEALSKLDFWPDILHVNDWQTGLIPVLLREHYRGRAHYGRIRTMFTIHNLAYQGTFGPDVVPRLGLPWHLYNMDQLEFHGGLNYLKAGLVFSDRLTTVSPTYAKEIQTKYFGCGLQGVLLNRSSRLTGIVNGIDIDAWDPQADADIKGHYTIDNFEAGKGECKRDLQAEMRLKQDPDVPLLGVIARLAWQKGIDLIIDAAEEMTAHPAQLVVLGTGEEVYHEQLRELQMLPDRVAIRLEYSDPLAHRIEAGSDLFLMPSRYEPCGLNQLYSLRYGTPPVVRSTGGLVDTVTDASDKALDDGTATGFSFVSPSSPALAETVARAITMWRERPELFRQLIRTGMAQNWSWQCSAEGYSDLYSRLVTERDSRALAGYRGKPQ